MQPVQKVSYLLSRVAFVMTHVAFFMWLGFMLNDPLNLGINTIDSKEVLSSLTCTKFDGMAALMNVVTFVGIWWAPHSLLARKSVKQMLGIWDTPVERPLYSMLAPISLILSISSWKPVTNCTRLDLFDTLKSLSGQINAGIMFSIWGLACGLLFSFFYLMPDHVFGINDWKADKTKTNILFSFPYSVVRHPLSAAFLWMYTSYLALMNWSLNSVLTVIAWSAFSVIGSLMLEERGWKDKGELNKSYQNYKSKVNAFFPSIWSMKYLLTGGRGVHVD